MMIELLYISKWGAQLNLTDDPHFWLMNVDGLTEGTTDIYSETVGGIDGDIVNNIQARPRMIIFDLRVASGVNVEEAKRHVLSVVKLKQPCTIQWTQNNRVWTITGFVESAVMPRFSDEVTMQISIHCEKPFWEDVDDTIAEINEYLNLHYFTNEPQGMLYFPDEGLPFGEYDMSRTRTFDNTGDVAVGMVIEVLAYKTVTNPIIHAQGGAYFGVGYDDKPLTMSAGDKLVIDTNSGQKSVKLNGVSVLSKVKPFSTWLQLDAGENEFSVESEDAEIDNMTFSISFKQRYV